MDGETTAAEGIFMKIVQKPVAKFLAVAGAVLLASCASTPAPVADNNIDYAKMAQIERAARHYGTKVIWVNFPTKHDATTQ